MNAVEHLQQKVLEKIHDAEQLLRTCDSMSTCQGKSKLQRKIQAEIKFLRNLFKFPERIKEEHLRCTNLAYLSAVIACSFSAEGFVDVLKPFSFPEGSLDPTGRCPDRIVVDVVAGHGGIWYKVVARNPQALLVSSLGDGEYGRRTIVDQLQEMVECSQHHPHLYHAPCVKLWATQTVCDSLRNIVEGVGAEIVDSKDTHAAVQTTSTSLQADSGTLSASYLNLCDIPNDATLNLDVSTMIAYVSALTNGRCCFRFQENILTEQAESERQSPVKPVLDALFNAEGRRLICCQTAHDEFVKITRIMAGPTEREATRKLLERLMVVPDEPSERAVSLPLCGKVKERSKIIFGTGDALKTITVTANGGFLRAACARGVDFAAFVHESRALTEAKEKTAVPL